MTPEVSVFIPVLLEDTGKNIEVAEQVGIKMCNNNEDTFIATLHNVLLEPDLCNRLFPIIVLMNSGHTYLFHKGFCTV